MSLIQTDKCSISFIGIVRVQKEEEQKDSKKTWFYSNHTHTSPSPLTFLPHTLPHTLPPRLLHLLIATPVTQILSLHLAHFFFQHNHRTHHAPFPRPARPSITHTTAHHIPPSVSVRPHTHIKRNDRPNLLSTNMHKRRM